MQVDFAEIQARGALIFLVLLTLISDRMGQ
jgi:hypothetical protein